MIERKKLGMVSADPQNLSMCRGRLRGRLVRQAPPSVEVTNFKMDMMIIHDRHLSVNGNGMDT